MQNYSVYVQNNIIEENLYYNKKILLSYKIEYPQFFLPRFQNNLNKINLYYKNKAYELQKTCFKKIFIEAIEEYNYSISKGYPVRQFQILLTYNITYNQYCALSLYFEQYDYLGGAHGMTYRYSDTWDIESANKIILSDLFHEEVNYQNYIKNIINNQIYLKQKYDNNFTFFEDTEKKVAETLNTDSFNLTANPYGIMVYFQLYDIAPYSMGIPEFFIPYNPKTMTWPHCNSE